MNLSARVARLEAAARQVSAQPCRWCRTTWTYPDDFPLVDGVRPPLPDCEAPDWYPGGGLLVTISNGTHEEAFHVPPADAYRTA